MEVTTPRNANQQAEVLNDQVIDQQTVFETSRRTNSYWSIFANGVYQCGFYQCVKTTPRFICTSAAVCLSLYATSKTAAYASVVDISPYAEVACVSLFLSSSISAVVTRYCLVGHC